MIGIGAFEAAYVSLGISVLLSALKWAQVTQITKKRRQIIAFTSGTALLIIATIGIVVWTKKRERQARDESKKLEPLKTIPGLQKQLADLPEMRQTILNLQRENRAATTSTEKKQELIEELTQTVITQQKVIALSAHQDLQKTESVLSTNINQYRTDTSSAVARIIRPPRTLGDKREMLIRELKTYGPHQIAITTARGSTEAINFSQEIESAFNSAGWTVVPTQKLSFLVRDGIGLRIVIKNLPNNITIQNTDLTPDQLAVAKAFFDIGMRADGNPMINGESGVTELFVGLQ